MAKEKTIKITLLRSVIGSSPKQRSTVRSLGFTRRGQTLEKLANPAILGMINRISHMVKVEE